MMYHRLTAAAGAVALVPALMTAAPAHAATAHREPIKPATSGYALCLYHNDNWCMSAKFDAAGTAIAIINDTLFGTGVYGLIKWLDTSGAAIVAKVIGVIGNMSKSLRSKMVNHCIGSWTYGKPLTFGSCSSRHGIYWTTRPEGGAGDWLWNTYESDWMTTGAGLTSGESIWDSSNIRGRWHDWTDRS